MNTTYEHPVVVKCDKHYIKAFLGQEACETITQNRTLETDLKEYKNMVYNEKGKMIVKNQKDSRGS